MQANAMFPGLPSFPITQIYFKQEPCGSFTYKDYAIDLTMAVQGYWCQALGFGIVAISTTIETPNTAIDSQGLRELVMQFQKSVVQSLLNEDIEQAKYCIFTDGGTGAFFEQLMERKDSFHVRLINFVERMKSHPSDIPVLGDAEDNE